MKTLMTAFAIAFCCVTAPLQMHAQQAADSSSSSRPAEFDFGKSPGLALVLEYLLAPLGHAYAGDVSRGLAPAAAHYGGAALIFAALAMEANSGYREADGAEATFYAGLALAVGGKVWGMVSAHSTASDYNKALRNRVGVSAGYRAGRAEIGFKVTSD